ISTTEYGKLYLKKIKLAKHNNFSEEKIRSFLLRKSTKMKLDENKDQHETGGIDDEDISALLNELNVYQFELEMQNDELKASYDALDAERVRFADLYDFAPVSYFIV